MCEQSKYCKLSLSMRIIISKWYVWSKIKVRDNHFDWFIFLINLFILIIKAAMDMDQYHCKCPSVNQIFSICSVTPLTTPNPYPTPTISNLNITMVILIFMPKSNHHVTKWPSSCHVMVPEPATLAGLKSRDALKAPKLVSGSLCLDILHHVRMNS